MMSHEMMLLPSLARQWFTGFITTWQSSFCCTASDPWNDRWTGSLHQLLHNRRKTQTARRFPHQQLAWHTAHGPVCVFYISVVRLSAQRCCSTIISRICCRMTKKPSKFWRLPTAYKSCICSWRRTSAGRYECHRWTNIAQRRVAFVARFAVSDATLLLPGDCMMT